MPYFIRNHLDSLQFLKTDEAAIADYCAKSENSKECEGGLILHFIRDRLDSLQSVKKLR